MQLGESTKVKVTDKITNISKESSEFVIRMKYITIGKPLTHNGELWRLKNNINNDYR